MTAGAFAGLAPCVHCGFCLQSCPTYLVTGDESDSPRGRILLLRALEHGELPARDPALIRHIDRCLGCRACEPVCPSGVSYAPALEEARRRFAEARPTSAAVRLVLTVMAEPLVRTPLLALARLVRPVAAPLARLLGDTRAGFLAGMLAATDGRDRRVGGSEGWRVAAPAGPAFDRALARSADPPIRRSAVIFRGCIMDGLFSHVHRATARALAVNGFRLVAAPGQSCCGALHAHAGFEAEARALARRNVAVLTRAGADRIVVNSAGCGAALKEYQRLLAGDPLEPAARAIATRVRDVTEALAEAGPRAGAPVPLSVAYDPPCHLLHAQRITREPLAVLDAVPGLKRVPLDEAELCCGSAGSYSLSESGLSREILARKVAAIERAHPDVVATGNPGCVMQIGAGLRARGLTIPVVHPVEILDRSYRAAGLLGSAES